MPKREETIAMTFRVGTSRAAALKRLIDRLPYRTNQSALIDRAIDLLVDDAKKKGEVK